jgi:signal transduction histidine kinase/CHASE3 domain sensor protein
VPNEPDSRERLIMLPPREIRNWPVRHKLAAILAITLVPVIGFMLLYLTTLQQFLLVQEEVNRLYAVQLQTQDILSEMTDAQDGFRGFVLTRNEKFLEPFYAAQENFDPSLHRLKGLIRKDSEHQRPLARIEEQVRAFLQVKNRLINDVRFGNLVPVREHIESGRGAALLAEIQNALSAFEELEKTALVQEQRRANRLAMVSRSGIVGGIIGIMLLWWLGGRLLARTITSPLATLTFHALQFGKGRMTKPIPIVSTDELGRLARTMEQMAERIEHHISQREAFHEIGKEISTVGPDGLEGVLKRIAERAGNVLGVDIALVLLWNERIGCWNIGAASGKWHDLLRRSVLIQEETSIATKALTTGTAQMVEDLSTRAEPVLQIRDRLGAKSLLAVPLRGQEGAFGVLALAPTSAKRRFSELEVRLAQDFADQAAIAIMNARLYEAAHHRGEGLHTRLQELERYAANMAHDLKGPARRMAYLASLLQIDYKGRFDERADRYLGWICENGQQLMARIEEVLRLARIGSVREVLEAVDPLEVIDSVLKGCAEQIERSGAKVQVAENFPRVACNHIHLFQILDNLIRNALKFSSDKESPELEIGVWVEGHLAVPGTWEKGPVPAGSAREAENAGSDSIDLRAPVLFVRDNGIGIASEDRERVFEPFERLGRHEAPGTGIGLAIVKKIIELYQGQVWVESELGQGSTFCFTLPLYGELARAQGAPEEAQA